jgi:hypothetical protein
MERPVFSEEEAKGAGAEAHKPLAARQHYEVEQSLLLAVQRCRQEGSSGRATADYSEHNPARLAQLMHSAAQHAALRPQRPKEHCQARKAAKQIFGNAGRDCVAGHCGLCCAKRRPRVWGAITSKPASPALQLVGRGQPHPAHNPRSTPEGAEELPSPTCFPFSASPAGIPLPFTPSSLPPPVPSLTAFHPSNTPSPSPDTH